MSRLITHRYAFADVQRAFETYRDRRDGALKVMIDFISEVPVRNRATHSNPARTIALALSEAAQSVDVERGMM